MFRTTKSWRIYNSFIVHNFTLTGILVLQVAGVSGGSYQVPPEDYTMQAWLACLCCFWPIGLMAVLRAYEVTLFQILLSPMFLIKRFIFKLTGFFIKKSFSNVSYVLLLFFKLTSYLARVGGVECKWSRVIIIRCVIYLGSYTRCHIMFMKQVKVL